MNKCVICKKNEIKDFRKVCNSCLKNELRFQHDKEEREFQRQEGEKEAHRQKLDKALLLEIKRFCPDSFKTKPIKKKDDNMNEMIWIDIDYSKIDKKLFDKYNIKPFQIMKRKMRNNKGGVWNNISFFNAKTEAEKLGYRIFGIKELLLLLEAYKEQGKKVSFLDNEFLGIEELSINEYVWSEWIEVNEKIAFARGSSQNDEANAGVFVLDSGSLSDRNTYVGFRCVRDIQDKTKRMI